VFFKKIVGNGITDKQIVASLTRQGLAIAWIEDLKVNRREFFHQRAPWIAVGVLNQDPMKMDLILLRRNIVSIQSLDNYLGLDRLRIIYKGFVESMPKLQEYVVGMIQ
jgi:hypothetical protein